MQDIIHVPLLAIKTFLVAGGEARITDHEKRPLILKAKWTAASSNA